jgi:phosphoribosylglycinamide formyltransferase 2
MRLGCEVVAVDRYANAPAMQVAHRSHVVTPMTNASALRAVLEAERSRPCAKLIVVPEIEAIATDELVAMEAEGPSSSRGSSSSTTRSHC